MSVDGKGTSAGAARRVVLVTGMSGAGKTSALKALEDLDFEAIDNVPLSLFEALVIGSQHEFSELSRPLAIGAMLGEVAKDRVVLTSGARPGGRDHCDQGVRHRRDCNTRP